MLENYGQSKYFKFPDEQYAQNEFTPQFENFLSSKILSKYDSTFTNTLDHSCAHKI